jgi:hypothetical protein
MRPNAELASFARESELGETALTQTRAAELHNQYRAAANRYARSSR